MLQGKKNDAVISMAMFDNAANPGYPAYAHARGYGLFSINNFGQNSYEPKMETRSLKLEKGQSVTLYHRLYVQSGKALTAEEANRIFEEFNLTSILKP
jgi:VCBS repeat-containing protein